MIVPSNPIMAAIDSVCSWGYVILISKFLVLFIDSGIAKSFGVLLPTMVERFDSDYATMGLICSMPATLQYLFAPFVALTLRKFNSRFVAMFGGLLTASCILGFGFIRNTVAAAVLLALSGMGQSIVYISSILAVNDFFKDNFVLVNTITLYGYTIGSMLTPIITERAFQAYGYTGSLMILSGMSLHLVVCGAVIRKAPLDSKIKQPKSQPEEHEDQTPGIVKTLASEKTPSPKSDEHSPLMEIDSPHFDGNQRDESPQGHSSKTTSLFHTCRGSCGLLNEPLFLFSIPIHFVIFYTLYSWMLFLIPHSEQLGIPPSHAVYLSTLGGVGGVVGRTLFIIMVIIVGNGFNLMMIIYIIIGTMTAASFLLDFTSSAYQVRAVLAFGQGFCLFSEDPITATLCKDAIFDDRNFDMAIALSAFTGGMGATCSGLLTGHLFDVFRSFTKVFIIIGFIHALAVGHLILLTILLRRRQNVTTLD